MGYDRRAEIDVLRHGRALPAGAGGDSARPLSPGGVEEVARLGACLQALGAGPIRVLASPLLRAQQTAEIVRQLVDEGFHADRLWQ
jgi:phosphohistidine phosphatase